MIELRDVTKVFRSPLGRDVRAVEGFSFRVARGEVLGIAGPNGAGKSTLIDLLLGFLRPTSGAITIEGVPPREYVERRGVGYLSELVHIPPSWTLEGALVRYALLAGVPDAELAPGVARAIARLGLEEHRGKRVRHLSRGTLQRLGLAQAIVRDQALVIFDEPTNGLDPVWVHRFRALVREMRAPDRTILIASHDLVELERVADRVAIIDRGRLARVVEVGARPGAAGSGGGVGRWRIELADGGEQASAVFPGAEMLAGGVVEVDVPGVDALNAGLAELIARGARITALAPVHPSLERQFHEAVRE